MEAQTDIGEQAVLATADSKQEAMERAFAARREVRRHAVTDEIRRRAQLNAACLQSEDVRKTAKQAVREDPVRFADDWLWTYDPRNAGRSLPTKLPFRLRPRQKDLMGWLRRREDTESNGLVEKSREEGMTFTVLAYFLHAWLFREGFAGGIGSRKEDLVDKKDDPKALFPKLRYMLYALPEWMQPEGFSRGEHDNFLRLYNPDMGSSITGEAGDNIGRGGRTTLYFVDEWAFVEHPRSADAALSDNTNVRVYGSTPNGVGNRFYEDRHSGRMDVFTMHWRDNPAKNYEAAYVDEEGQLQRFHPWYEKKKLAENPLTIAQEVDISYTASAENTVIPAQWVQAAVGIDLPLLSPRRAGLDVASAEGSSEGGDDDVYCSRAGPHVLRVETLARANAAVKASCVSGFAKEDGVAMVSYDRLGVGEGITATLKHKEEELSFEVRGVANSEKPTNAKLDDKPDVPAHERFYNFGAEMWWGLRLRFKATYERASGIKAHPPASCISIPNNATLVAQLSQPTYSKNSKEQVRVHKKGEGGSSPDHAEALLYAFAPRRRKKLPKRQGSVVRSTASY